MYSGKAIGSFGICVALIGIVLHRIYTMQLPQDSQVINPPGEKIIIERAILASLPPAVITTVDSYQGLIDVAGQIDDAGTGVRFAREVIMLVHDGEACEPDFKAHNLEIYGQLVPEDVVLVSADLKRVDQEFLSKFEVGSEPTTCPTAVVVKHRTRISDPEFYWIPFDANKRYSISHGVMRTQEAHVGTVNDYPFPITVFYKWGDDPERVHLKSVEPGKEKWMRTYRATELIARTLEGTELQRMRVRSDALFTVSDRHCNIEDCGIIERPDEVVVDAEELAQRKQHDQFRLKNNNVQPKKLPKFTEVGFSKRRVPDDIWDKIINYYNQNKERPKIERWHKGNVYTNNLEAPSYMVPLPESGPLKPAVFNGLRPILEEWAGVELVSTACYGVRAYTSGSWLSNHVDISTTHVISVIINVDQEVTEPWPLMIYDHAGNDYNITMEPRDMVLYESATCVHGRPSVFNGKFFANMFVHYKPKDPTKWESIS